MDFVQSMDCPAQSIDVLRKVAIDTLHKNPWIAQ